MRTDADPVARRLLEDYAENAARRSGLPDAARVEARLELYSHLYEVAAEKASAEGATALVPAHAQAAIGALGTPEAVDAAFFASRRAKQERAEWAPRAFAYIVDAILFNVVLWAVLWPLLGMLFFFPFGAAGAFDCDPGFFGPDCSWSGWPGAPWMFTAMPLLWMAGPVLTIFAFAGFEALKGQTPGKMLLHLRVAAATGGPLSWRQAILRNLVKFSGFLLLLDAVGGHLAYGDARERLSDRLAGTAVVREVK